MTDTIKITQFAGQAVPEDGLEVHPPQGGTLMIWPDGGYVFTPPESGDFFDGEAPVTTYYNYVLEDIDGTSSAGTFAFSPVVEDAHAADFQAWSLPGILETGEHAASLFETGGEGAGHDMPLLADAVDIHGHMVFAGVEHGLDDDLTLLIATSQHI